MKDLLFLLGVLLVVYACQAQVGCNDSFSRCVGREAGSFRDGFNEARDGAVHPPYEDP